MKAAAAILWPRRSCASIESRTTLLAQPDDLLLPVHAATDHRPRHDLLRQAIVARLMGSPFVARVLEAAFRQLDAAPRLAAKIDGWTADPAASAMALRLNSALHALARQGHRPDLTRLYRDGEGDFDHVLRGVLTLDEPFIIAWMQHPTQTNEVGRAALFMAALMQLDGGSALPVELLELGASAGLNLNLARYHHVLADIDCGETGAAVRIEPLWSGPRPAVHPLHIATARGVDLNPVDLADPAARARLLAYVWPGEVQRMRQLAAAIAIARLHPPQVEQGRAGDWLAAQLDRPQASGTRRVVLHSMVMQYLALDERRAIHMQLSRAGASATPERPLALIALEWRADRTEVTLAVTHWWGGRAEHGDGVPRVVATCHPYGQWIDWRG